jgi:hypothetical protein
VAGFICMAMVPQSLGGEMYPKQALERTG